MNVPKVRHQATCAAQTSATGSRCRKTQLEQRVVVGRARPGFLASTPASYSSSAQQGIQGGNQALTSKAFAAESDGKKPVIVRHALHVYTPLNVGIRRAQRCAAGTGTLDCRQHSGNAVPAVTHPDQCQQPVHTPVAIQHTHHAATRIPLLVGMGIIVGK